MLIFITSAFYFKPKFYTMSLLKEFKEFVMKGNIVELAIAVVIGAAFASIVSSLVEDVVTPLLLTPALKAAHVENLSALQWGAVKYGNFLAAVIKFLVIAFVLFLVIKSMSRIIKKKEAPAAGPSSTDVLLMEIRDELRKR